MRLALVVIGLVACNSEQAPVPAPQPVATPKPAPARPAPAKPGKAIASPLPEAGPHPDYPTPAAAGTDKIFLLEEPDRGPKAPIDFTVPASAKPWTESAYCEPGPNAVVCAGQRAGAIAGWRVRREPNLVVAESRRGDATIETYAYVLVDGATTKRIELDEHGRVQAALLFATPHRYTARERSGANGLAGCGAMDLDVDKAGRVTAERCLQWNGEPMRDTSGVAKVTYARDKRGFALEEARFGLDGAATASTTGVHRVVYELDAAGRVVVERYFGTDGARTASTLGCHGYRNERDARGLLARATCIGADDKPANDSTGVATHEHAYDAQGCEIRSRKLGAPGSSDPHGDGDDYVVDAHCEITSHTCVKADGNRRNCGVGEPAREDHKRDALGRVISTSHFHVDGTPATDPTWGVFEVRDGYDDLDRRTSIACFDGGGTAVVCGTYGYHRQDSVYDDAGREVTRTFVAPDGSRAHNIGAATRKFTYDNYDHLFEARGFDDAGTLIDTLGMAIQRDLYDSAHRTFAMVLLDRAGQPARYTGCFGGHHCPKVWHAVRIVRAADGTATSNQFFDAAGQLVETAHCKSVRCFK